MVKINQKAQSTIEYALLFGIVVAAFIAIQYYLNQNVQGKLKQIQDELNEPIVDQNGKPF
jgi:uncharacterized protein (UPF0333 family)